MKRPENVILRGETRLFLSILLAILGLVSGAAAFVVVLVAGSGGLAPNAANAQSPSGLVSRWAGEGNANDSQDGNHGTLVNGATFAAGKVGQAFSFDGIDDFVALGNPANLRITGAMTIDLWVNIAGSGTGLTGRGEGGRTTLFAKWDDIGTGTAGYGMFLLEQPAGTFKVEFFVSSTGSNAIGSVSATALAKNTWYHVAGVYDGSFVRVYVNGIQEASTPHTAGIFNTTAAAEIGAVDRPGGDAHHFQGRVDELEIFNRALSAEEIAVQFGGPVSWWKGEGDAQDSQDGNHGTLMNGATFAAGKVGQAFSLDGTNYVMVPPAVSLDMTSEMTMAAWINPTDCVGSYCAIVAKSDYPAGERAYGMWLHGSNPDGNAGTGALVVEGSQVGIQAYSPPAVIPIGSGCFTHVAAVIRSGVSSELYINGDRTSTTYRIAAPVLSATSANTVPLTIGLSDPSFDYLHPEYNGHHVMKFHGLIDEVMIFNRALTATEIAATYTAGGAGMCEVGPLDTTPPTTTATPSPRPNPNGWNNTTVTVDLSAEDNPGGSGVKEISYTLSGATLGGSVVAGNSASVPISAEGSTTITYFATDIAGNQESPKTLMVRIDKSPPEMVARCAPPGGSPFLTGRDLSGITSVVLTGSSTIKRGEFKRQETYTILDKAGNRLEASFGVKAEGHETEFTLLSLSYNGGVQLTLPENELKCEWATEKTGILKELEQKLEIGRAKSEVEVQAKFEGKKNETEIKVKTHGSEPHQRVTRPGLVFLNLTTNQGALGVDY